MALEKHEHFTKGKLTAEEVGTTGHLKSVDVKNSPVSALTGKEFTAADSFDNPTPQSIATQKKSMGVTDSPTPGIDTSQPSPTKLPESNVPGALPNQSVPVAPATPSAKISPAQATLNAAQASGLPAPQNAGQARLQGAQFTPPKLPDTSNIDQSLQSDPGYQQLLADRAEYTKVANQGQSLVKQYQQMIKQAGIPAINTELLNTKNIIDGTENDIRKEVQAVSGFATNSQVLALASARNKQLIQNYNNLLDTKSQAMESINTMIGLAKEDQSNALSNITQKMNFDSQILDYRDKFVNNAKEGFNNVIKATGYAGLLASLQQDPSSIPLVERTLGLAPGGLTQLANYAPPQTEEEKLDLQYKKGQIALQQSNLATDKLQRSNIQSQINERNNPVNTEGTINGKPQNASQSSANSYANRLSEANVTLDSLASKFTGTGTAVSNFLGKLSPNFLKSGDRQAVEQAQNNFVTAVLRRESGASIAPSEFETAAKIYFPQPGDTASTIAQKAQTRNTVINNFYKEANVARPVSAGQIIESGGKRYKVGADGEMLTEI